MDKPIDAPPLRWFLGHREQRSLAWRYWGKETIQGLSHLAIHNLMRAAPVDLCSRLGDAVGRWVGPRYMQLADQRAQRNWALLRPDEADRAKAVTENAFGQAGRVHWEFSAVDRLTRLGRIATEGGEHIAAARSAGRPVIVLGIHLSNWEVIGAALAQLGHHVTTIYQPPPNRFDHRIVIASRRRWGAELVPPNAAGARLAYRALMSRKGILGIYVDECIDEHIYAPFFGRPIKLEGNITRAARFAAMADAAVILGYTLRGEGAQFRTTFLPPIDLIRGRDADLLENVSRINATIEPVIRRHLDQWFWLFDLKLAE